MKKDAITYDDFAKLDIRVGTVKDAQPVSGSDKLLELTVYLGEDYGEKSILAGIAAHYDTDDLIGHQMLFLANLEPKKMMGKESQGMMLAVDSEKQPYIISLKQELADGDTVC